MEDGVQKEPGKAIVLFNSIKAAGRHDILTNVPHAKQLLIFMLMTCQRT